MILNLGFAKLYFNIERRKRNSNGLPNKNCDSCIHRKEHMFIVYSCDIDNYSIKFNDLIGSYWECKHYKKK